MGITAEQIAIEGALFGLQDMTDRQVGPKRVTSLTMAEPAFPIQLLK
jgi:hypothetical protein